jgi:hypothetical protein
MKRTIKIAGMVIAVSLQNFAAAQSPKEGTYDYVSCWSGVSNTIEFSKSHSAYSYEMTGSIRSNSPGGMFDQNSFRCVGVNHSFDGKVGATTICEAIDKDGHKRLSFFSTHDGKVVRETIAGTGKYEGVVMTGTVQPMGPFPVIKPGTFQNCNRQSGTYKLK